MIEPFSLLVAAGTTVLNFTKTYGGADLLKDTVAGMVGNRADALLDKVIGGCFRHVRRLWLAPLNPGDESLLKALEMAKLKATAFLMDATITALKSESKRTGDYALQQTAETLTVLYPKWERTQKKALLELVLRAEETVAFQRTETLLTAVPLLSATQISEELIQMLKIRMLQELEDGLYFKMPETLLNFLREGWMEKGKKLDWYEVFSLSFSALLQEKQYFPARTAFETMVLADLKEDVSQLKNQSQAILMLLEGNTTEIKALVVEKWIQVEQWLRQLDQTFAQMQGGIDAILEKLDRNSNDTDPVGLTDLDNLRQRLFKLQGVLEIKRSELNVYMDELERLPASQSARKAVESTQGELLEIAAQLNEVQKNYEQLVRTIKEQKKFLDQIEWAKAGVRLKEVRRLFESGEFKAVEQLLHYEGREAEIKEIIEQKKGFLQNLTEKADEEVMLAFHYLFKGEADALYHRAEQHLKNAVALSSNDRNHLQYALFLHGQFRYTEAVPHYQRAFDLSPTDHLEARAGIQNNLGLLYKYLGLPEEAEIAYREALNVWQVLAEQTPTASIQRSLAQCYGNLAVLFGELGQMEDAQAAYQKEVTLLRQLVEEGKAAQLDLGRAMSNFGALLHLNNRFEEGRAYLMEAWGFFASAAEEDEDARLMSASILINLASGVPFESRNSFQYYTQALALNFGLKKINPFDQFTQRSKIHTGLGLYFKAQGDLSKAHLHFTEALLAYESLQKYYPNTFISEILSLLRQLGHLHRQELPKARSYWEYALQLCHALFKEKYDVFEVAFYVVIDLAQLFPDPDTSMHYLKVATSIVHIHKQHPFYHKAASRLQGLLQIRGTNMDTILKQHGFI